MGISDYALPAVCAFPAAKDRIRVRLLCSQGDGKGFGMAKSTTMTVRLKPEVSDKLEVLACDMKRSKAYLASEAIEAYVDVNSWQIAHIKEALEEDRADRPGISHEEVVEWMNSWGTGHER